MSAVRSAPPIMPTPAASDARVRPPKVITWLRDPASPLLGKTFFTDWTLHAGGPDGVRGYRSFQIGKDTHVVSDTALLQRYRFAHDIHPAHRSEAIAIADEAARMVAASPSLTSGRLRELDPGTPFFGTLTDDNPFIYTQRPDIAVGEGKILVDDGTSVRVWAGRLADMPDVRAATKAAVDQLMKLPTVE